jgi:RES domain-containing protein
MQFARPSGLFYRIVPASRSDQALAPAVSPEGRFHHNAEPALYVSSRPDWACHAIASYVRHDDPPRMIVELSLTAARFLDLRDPTHCATFGIDPALAAVPWLPERAKGRPASTWNVSDRARASGADGMIYTARTEPARWHAVLFFWPTARLTGRVLPYPRPGSSFAFVSSSQDPGEE